MQTIQDRLKNARLDAGYPKAVDAVKELNKYVELTADAYRMYERNAPKGEKAILTNSRKPPPTVLKACSIVYNKSINYFLFGDDTPQSSDGFSESPQITYSAELTPQVPVLGYVGAGAKVSTDGVDYPINYIESPLGRVAGTSALIVKGDSMLGLHNDGDVLFFNIFKAQLPQDRIGKVSVVKLTNDEIYVKQVMNGTNGKYTLLSRNSPPIHDVNIVWCAQIENVKPKD